MDFPTDKNFMYYEDNGDNTITVKVQFDEMKATVVFPGSLMDIIMTSLGPDFNFQSYMEEMVPTAVIIPDSLED